MCLQWLIYKNSVQYLVMMELQLGERQRERRLLSALTAWRGLARRGGGGAPGAQPAWRGAAVEARLERSLAAVATEQQHQQEASPEKPPLGLGDDSFDGSFQSFDSDGVSSFPLFSSSHRVSLGRSQLVSPGRMRRSYGGAASGFSRRLSTRPQTDSALLGYRAGTNRQMATTLTYWKRFTRHHMWRRQRVQSSLRFSHWLRKLACFKQMRLYSAEEIHSRRVQRHAVRRLLRHRNYLVFVQWARCSQAGARRREFHRECIRRIVNSSAHRVISAAFDGWLSFGDTAARNREYVQTARERSLRRRFREWRTGTADTRSARNACEVLGTRQVRRRKRQWQRACFYALHHVSALKARMKRIERKVILRMQGSVCASCFETWWSAVLDLRSVLWGRVLNAMRAWQEHTKNERAFKAKLRSSVWRWKFHFQMATFRRWRVFALYAVHFQLQALALFGKFGKKTLWACFEGWKAHLCDLAKEEVRMLQTYARIKSVAQGKAFRRWTTWASEKQTMRRRGRRAILKMLRRQASRCFNTWTELTVTTRRTRNFLQKWLHFGLSAALSRWVVFVSEKQWFDRTMAKIVGRLTNRALSKACTGWATATQRAARELRLLIKVRAAIEERLQGKAFRKWAAWAIERKTVQVLCTRAIFRMQYRAASLCMNAWIEVVVKFRRLRSFVTKWTHLSVSGAFRRWAIFVVESQRVMEVIGNLTRQVMNQFKKAAFSAWLDTVRTGRIRTQAVAKVAAKLRFGGARTAFIAWSTFFRTKRDQLRQMDWVALRIQKLHLFQVWERWLGFVRSAIMMRWAMLRLTQHVIARAWTQWIAFVNAKIDQRNWLQRVILRMSNMKRAVAFRGWIAAVEMSRHALFTLARVHNIMLNRCLARAFRTWCAEHEGIVMARNSTEQKQRAVIVRLLRSAMAKAFDRWRSVLYQRVQLHKVAARIRSFRLSQGFVGWLESMEIAQDNRTALLAALVKMRNGTTARAFVAWVTWLDTRRTTLIKIAVVLRRLCNRALATAFFGWLDHALLRKHQHALLKVALMRAQTQHVARALWRWSVLASRRRFLGTIMMKLQRSTLTRAFVSFRCAVYRKIQIEEGMISVISMWQERATLNSFNAWAANVDRM